MTSLEELKNWVNEQIANGSINDKLISENDNVRLMVDLVHGKYSGVNHESVDKAAASALELIKERS